MALLATACAGGGQSPATIAASRDEVLSADECQWIEATYSSPSGFVGTALLHVESGGAAWVPINTEANEALIEISAVYIDDKTIEVQMRRGDLLQGPMDEILWYGPPIHGDGMAMGGVITRSVLVPATGPWPELDSMTRTEIIGSISLTCNPDRKPGLPPDWNSFAI